MKLNFLKFYLTFFIVSLFLINDNAFSKSSNINHSKESVANYFSGIVFASQDYTKKAFIHFKKVKFLKESHSNYNAQFVRTLVLLGKFDQAFSFSKSIWKEEEFIFEIDLIMGLNYFIKNDFLKAEKHFNRLNKITEYNLYFNDLFGNILISWIEASKKNQKKSVLLLDKIPDSFYGLKQINSSFLHCYFDDAETSNYFKKLIETKNYSFSRYNFFLINYLLHKGKDQEAKKIIQKIIKENNSNLLLRQTEDFISNHNSKKIINFFNCKNPKDNIAEIFYIIANLYSSQDDYQLSNFFIRISLFLNGNFSPNKSLLAENLYFQKKYEDSKKITISLKSIGPIYSWYAARQISTILLDLENEKMAISYLQNEFDAMPNPTHQDYYELANFYKNNENYNEAIEYYSLALNDLPKEHYLFSKILENRGTSYERIGDWDKAEKDLLNSLKILPEQPYVLNYLAYSWVDRGENIDEALEMLELAVALKKNDGYIIDSLGWAHFKNKNYINAEKYLRIALKILPQDPIIHDHYADTLWMLKKNIQARHIWKNILNLEGAEKELKDKVSKKILFGLNQKL